MKAATKIWLSTAAALVVLGLTVIAIVTAVSGCDFTGINTYRFETNTHEISEEFSSISMDTETADITFVPSDDGTCRVVCFEMTDAKHSVTVENDTLVIRMVDERKWHDFIGISINSTPELTVYLPETEYASLSIDESTGDISMPADFTFEAVDLSLSTGDVSFLASASGVIRIETSTGNILVEGASAQALELTASTGHITVSGVSCEGDVKTGVSTGRTSLTDVSCRNLTTDGNTGALSMNSVIVSEKITVTRSTGDVKFEGCDAAEVFIETDTGDVTGSFLSEKIFYARSDTGSVDVPRSTTGGICEIILDTGDISITIE